MRYKTIIRRRYVAVAAVAALAAAALIGRYQESMTWPHGGSSETGPELAAAGPLKPTDLHPRLGYSLDRVADIKAAPAIFIERLRADLSRIPDIDEKKRTFFRILLPHVARENDRIRAERQLIETAPAKVPIKMFEKYDVEPGDIASLLGRVDIVPASLVLAQAALESGWGSSRFALEGNNFFGLRTYDEETPGIKPISADGFKLMRFNDIGHSVRAYLRTLNTHGAYAGLRKARAQQRAAGTMPDGMKLTPFLTAYSEIPEKYGSLLRDVINAGVLGRFDGVRLAVD